ncbi:MAG TPA: Sec-independent protein translocase protein TatB [Dehalococcoidia bacterium]|nr:Sec-independent protein translocase protein TatB [Dehalococcoidia bacterium]
MDPLGIGIGGTQIIVVLIVAFFVLGPERLPEVARTIAKGVRTLRSYAADVQGQFEGEIGDLRDQFSDIQRDFSATQESLRGGLSDLDSSLRTVHSDVNAAVSSSIVSFEAAREARQGGAESPVAPGDLATEPESPAAPATFDYAPQRPAAAAPHVTPAEPAGLAAAGAGDGPRPPEYRPPV